ncbi:MAG: hypothetical protein ABS56_17845 [Lautropia sp. SCN 69-89]|nr:MAG: hypothetical protein ABS56_17845 [Lautropia sp. SCN 69-89]
MKIDLKKVACRTAAATALSSGAAAALAADWVMLQAMEPPTATHRVFGVVQASYTNFFGCDKLEGMRDVGPNRFSLLNGSYNGNCRVGPELRDRQSDFNLDNLGFGARGNLIPSRINYFLMANAGMNGATYDPLDTKRARLIGVTDATMTFSYVPGVRVRVGLMKKPGPEEIYQGADAINYIWPTDFIARVQLERFVRTNTKGTKPIPGQSDGTPSFSGYDSDLGRDWGVQFFDAFKAGKWTHTYAAMIGQGSGVHDLRDYNGSKDLNLYFSSEYDLPGGMGPNKHGVKLYAYRQSGTRNFEITPDGTLSDDFDFTRHGFGVKALGEIFGAGRGRHRLGAELMYANGMVFYTPTGNVIDEAFGGQLQIAAEKGNKARGLTLDYGYYLNATWDFSVRYSLNDELYRTLGTPTWNRADYRKIKGLTFGVNYRYNPRTRLTVNLELRDVKAPNDVYLGGTAALREIQTSNARIVSDAVGARFGVQLTYSF